MISPAQANDIRDIKPPVYFPENYLLLIIIGIIIVLAGLVFLVLFLRRRMKRGADKPRLPEKTAYQLAYEGLLALKRENLAALGKIKEYYFRLSDIVRHYIESRFSIKAPEMTTEEFLFSLRDYDILSSRHKNLLKEFLGLCDIVKFAKYGPTQKEIDESFNAAMKLLEETKNDI